MNCIGLRSHPSFAYSAATDADKRIVGRLGAQTGLSNLVAAGLASSSRRVGYRSRQRQDLKASLDCLDEQSYDVLVPQRRPTEMDLQEFLTAAELQQYFDQFHNDLKVVNASQIKYVEDTDLVSIGMTKPEIRRLRQIYKKLHPQGAFEKLKKILVKSPAETNTSPPVVNDKQNPLKSTPSNNKHIISEDAIMLQKKLGSGEFGVVQQGIWTNERGERVAVAVKCLSKETLKSQMSEFLVEASNMCSVDHSNIVQLYGIVLGTDSLMLVTELAPLRTLLECLRDPSLRSTFTVSLICNLALQIVDGMAYLENRRLIHRDLAARNVLMFAKDKVKVSDFGLSRALGVEKDYYQSQLNTNLRLPIAWCAPECINFLKFTSASDVWSYGVTLWEMFTSGAQPWEGLTGLEIMEAVDEPNYSRLEQPERCPDDWYQLMLKCWDAEPADRPKFSEMFLISLNQIKPTRVVAISDASMDKSGWVRYKAGDIIVVLSKHGSSDNVLHSWKGVVESTNEVGFFDQTTTSPYIEVIPSNALLRKNKVSRVESSRSSVRTSRKITAGMIGAPQNDLRHIGHVGYDGAVFGDVSLFVGDDYRKLPVKVGNPQRLGESLAPLPNSNGGSVEDQILSAKFSQMTTSATFGATTDDSNDDFGDFEMPDMSLSFDFGSSLMDEMMKVLGGSTNDEGSTSTTLNYFDKPPEKSSEGQQQIPDKKEINGGDAEGSGTETGSDKGSSDEDDEDEEETSSAASAERENEKPTGIASSMMTTPAYSEYVSTTVRSDIVPKPLQSSAVLMSTMPAAASTTTGGSSFGATKQLLSLETFVSPSSDASEDTTEEEESDEENNHTSTNVKNGFSNGSRSAEPTSASFDELLRHKRNSSGSSGGQSAGHGSWNGGSEASVSSSNERLKAVMGGSLSVSSRAPVRTSNQNIRAPQGIPGRDAAIAARNPIIPAVSAPASEPDMDTNPLRRLRESQSGFSKGVFRASATSSSASRTESMLPPNNLNPNMSFFNKLKEQEQQRMH